MSFYFRFIILFSLSISPTSLIFHASYDRVCMSFMRMWMFHPFVLWTNRDPDIWKLYRDDVVAPPIIFLPAQPFHLPSQDRFVFIRVQLCWVSLPRLFFLFLYLCFSGKTFLRVDTSPLFRQLFLLFLLFCILSCLSSSRILVCSLDWLQYYFYSMSTVFWCMASDNFGGGWLGSCCEVDRVGFLNNCIRFRSFHCLLNLWNLTAFLFEPLLRNMCVTFFSTLFLLYIY